MPGLPGRVALRFLFHLDKSRNNSSNYRSNSSHLSSNSSSCNNNVLLHVIRIVRRSSMVNNRKHNSNLGCVRNCLIVHASVRGCVRAGGRVCVCVRVDGCVCVWSCVAKFCMLEMVLYFVNLICLMEFALPAWNKLLIDYLLIQWHLHITDIPNCPIADVCYKEVLDQVS